MESENGGGELKLAIFFLFILCLFLGSVSVRLRTKKCHVAVTESCSGKWRAVIGLL